MVLSGIPIPPLASIRFMYLSPIPWPEPITCMEDLQFYALPLITLASFLLLLAFL
jgi:hypothetical protein